MIEFEKKKTAEPATKAEHRSDKAREAAAEGSKKSAAGSASRPALPAKEDDQSV